MSDFDKEAEREKLRKKYEEDRKDREATQRMSDLLLKGARMTNTHCGTCGDPLFEQNDVTFCPTCHGGPEGVEASLDETDEGEGTDAEGGETRAEETPADGVEATAKVADEAATDADREVEVHTTDEGPDEADEPRAQVDPSPESEARRPPSSDRPSAGSARRSDQSSAGSARRSDPARDARARVSPTSVSGDLEGARDALVESLERFARRAAETDDPRYAKECLQAAREASEALAALR